MIAPVVENGWAHLLLLFMKDPAFPGFQGIRDIGGKAGCGNEKRKQQCGEQASGHLLPPPDSVNDPIAQVNGSWNRLVSYSILIGTGG